jgi:hypothetical protein
MIYLLLLSGLAALCWIAVSQRDCREQVGASRDAYWQHVFERAASASERGAMACRLCQQDPHLDADREHFANLCYQGKVTPDMAAAAWVERALANAQKR